MNFWVIAVSLLVGRLRGFRFGDFLAHQFRGLGWFGAALMVQMLIGTSFAESTPWIRALAPLLHVGAMGMLLAAILANRETSGALLCGLGVLLNLAVIFANGGKMPVSPEALQAVGMPATRIAFLAAGRSLTHRLVRPSTALRALGDILYLPAPVQRSPVFSVGDVVLAVGLFVLVQSAISQAARERRRLAEG
ncbi:MAG: hypothetical protein A2Y96_00945 [Firmicutes bacterium RBG_13_65_8]|nr:MAG: hypothetical protein A2Y96_00945 [Firmicutes bacterium RBG_13_65_8]